MDMENDISQSKKSVLLSGFGFYRLSVRRRKMLTYVFVGSLVAHIVGLAIFGGYIVMRSKPEEVAIFKTPPPARTYKPRELEHRVKVQKRQRSSSRPAMMPRMVSMKLSTLALPDIKVDPKIIQTTFQPKFRAVSGKGLGAGLGTGYGTHGFGAGMSTVNFFGIRATGERIAVLVDVSVSMVEEERGGVAGYMRVKSRVEDVVDAISEMSMFNLIVFADSASAVKPEMVVANGDNKNKAKLFLRPFNTEGNWGLTSGNIKQSTLGLKAGGGTTRLDLAITAALEQFADTILIISDGIPKVEKVLSAAEMDRQREQRRRWEENNSARLAAWDRDRVAYAASGEVVTEKVWIPPVAATKGPLKEGQVPRQARAGYWTTRTHRVGGRLRDPGPRPAPPKFEPGWWTLADFVQHITLLYEHYYVKKGKKQPVIHCIGYQIDKEGHAFLQKLSAQYHGKYRRVQRLR